MANLTEWAASAKERMDQYRRDRGESNKRSSVTLPRGGAFDHQGAGKELVRIADTVPPL